MSPSRPPAKMEEFAFENGMKIKFEFGKAKTNDGNVIINSLVVVI